MVIAISQVSLAVTHLQNRQRISSTWRFMDSPNCQSSCRK